MINRLFFFRCILLRQMVEVMLIMRQIWKMKMRVLYKRKG